MHFIKNILRFINLFFTDQHYRTFVRLRFILKGRNRYEPGDVSFDGFIFTVPDSLSFLWQYKEIFVDRNYDFIPSEKSPVILDCGANAGLSVLFFSREYPDAEIIAFEADPDIAEYLAANLQRNKINNVRVVAKAAWIHNNGLSFGQDGADGGSVYNTTEKKVSVPSVRLKEVIDSYPSVDFLKMDIEGAERDVLPDCSSVLHKVKNIFVEYHDYTETTQYLSGLASILESNGFRYYIYNAQNRKSPMKFKYEKRGMDLQLNIFATRVKNE